MKTPTLIGAVAILVLCAGEAAGKPNKNSKKMKLPVLTLLYLIFCLFAPLGNVFSEERLNIVVFLSDDLGRLDTSIHGSVDARTPTMDRLAADGLCGFTLLLPQSLFFSYRPDAGASRGASESHQAQRGNKLSNEDLEGYGVSRGLFW